MSYTTGAKDDDIIRILIHTDSHLGYRDRDPLRGNDSFASFEESLVAGMSNLDLFCSVPC